MARQPKRKCPLLPAPRRADLNDACLVDAGEPLETRDGAIPAQGYRIEIGQDGTVTISAADEAGGFYARQTLGQLSSIYKGRLPAGRIDDWPDFAIRGLMLDISRDKVPTMESLFQFVDRLSAWKVNHLQLYMEHTFAYREHQEVWRDASPMTPDEIRTLDRYCAQRHVELVPNQNCLGHFERWLKHETYRHLAIKPEGITLFGRPSPPTTLDPALGLPLVRSLLGELLPNFTARRVHVGLDEPWELPSERAGEFMDWIRSLRESPELDGREMLIWGDFLRRCPSADLPDGVTVCEWGYDSWHPFEERAKEYRVPFWVCPGTSSWLSILGRWENARPNLESAAVAGIKYGATGYLNTDWGDLGHIHYPPVSLPGIAYGAAVSWCRESNAGIDVAASLDCHAFEDEAGMLGEVLLDLGGIHAILTPQIPNIASIVLHLYYPEVHVGKGPLHLATSAQYGEAQGRLIDCGARIAKAHPQCHDSALVLGELSNAIDLVELLCSDAIARLEGDGSIGSVDSVRRTDFAERMSKIIDRHQDLWLARNRPGGLPDTTRRLEMVREAYRTGDTSHLCQ